MFWVRVYIDVFLWHNVFLLFNLHPKPHLWVNKMYPRFCLHCQFPWYFVWSVFQARDRQKKCYRKCRMSLSFTIFTEKYRPWCHICFVKNEKLRFETKVLQGIILRFIDIIHRNHSRSYYIKSFFYPEVGMIFEMYILSRSHKLADANSTGTLDSFSGTKMNTKTHRKLWLWYKSKHNLCKST